MNGHELKQLKTTKAKIEAEISRLRTELSQIQGSLRDAEGRLSTVVGQIKAATSQVVVSEHAILRYMERAMGVDLDEVRRKIMTEQTAEYVQLLGNGKFPIGDGMRAVVRDNVVISVVER